MGREGVGRYTYTVLQVKEWDMLHALGGCKRQGTDDCMPKTKHWQACKIVPWPSES